MLGKQDLYELIGATAYDPEGARLGTVDTVYVDTQTDEGTFVAVKTGLFGTRSSFVPLAGASLRDGDLHVAHAKSRVNDAPNVDADDRLDATQERELYHYYGIPVADEEVTQDAAVAASSVPGDPHPTGVPASRDADDGGPASGDPLTADPAMGDAFPTGADLIAGQHLDPAIDGPVDGPEERLRLRRLGDPIADVGDGLGTPDPDEPPTGRT